MTENFPLPPELEELERQLAARELPQPAPEAKERLLCGVRVELRRAQVRSRWVFSLATAATVLVWLNLSLCATRATNCGLEVAGPLPSVGDGADQIRQLLPELAPREALRQAVLLRAGAGVTACPRLSARDAAAQGSGVWKELTN
jgi:hypothetical protein